jgi:hypothetical protein|tara:strand:+ start:1765 stop:2589 length:825 start_codon:yes stop_codon:yes gene_type:complete
MNEVSKKKKSEISTNVIDFSNFAGAGFENVDAQEMAIPFLKIASSQTPEVKKSNAKYVEGLDQGNIFNSVTKDFYKGVSVIPCAFRVRGVEWSPLGEGTGAPVKIYEPKDIPPLTRGADGEDHYMINGAMSPTYIVRTAEYFVLRLNDDGSFERCQIIMQKTQYKKSRYWNTMMMNQKIQQSNGSLFTLPMFANVYRMEGIQEQNKKNDWWGWKIVLEKSVNDLKNPSYLVEEAKNFHELVSSGSIDPTPEALNDTDDDIKDVTPNVDTNVLGS